MARLIRIAPSPSIFGFGALASLSEELRLRKFKKILVITDPQIAAGGILEQVLNPLKANFELEQFQEAPTEPHSKDIDAQKERFGTDFDALLAVGGGSAMDFAKALAILMTHGGSLADYVGEGLVPGPVIPVVCVPTTSGTGSQSTQTTVFTIGGVKMGCSSEFIRPAFSVVDPELTLGLPSEITRNSGYDALMHAVESFVALDHNRVAERPILYQGSNSFSRGIALEAFRVDLGSLPKMRCERAGSGSQVRHVSGIAFGRPGIQPQRVGVGSRSCFLAGGNDQCPPWGLPGSLDKYWAPL